MIDELQRVIRDLDSAQTQYEEEGINDIGYARALRKAADRLERYIFEHMLSNMSR